MNGHTKEPERATYNLWPDVGRRLGIGRNAVYDAANKGQIPGAFKIGGRWLVSKAALQRLLNGQEAAAQ